MFPHIAVYAFVQCANGTDVPYKNSHGCDYGADELKCHAPSNAWARHGRQGRRIFTAFPCFSCRQDFFAHRTSILCDSPPTTSASHANFGMRLHDDGESAVCGARGLRRPSACQMAMASSTRPQYKKLPSFPHCLCGASHSGMNGRFCFTRFYVSSQNRHQTIDGISPADHRRISSVPQSLQHIDVSIPRAFRPLPSAKKATAMRLFAS